ncbi:hypothetical protein AA958_12310 [Streptomyces sp. CNQ-509]|uniref:protein phosphatase 2C domain-containing protein n=1 Tax=unclassified Streptomyces TaxID=2593676 RepID=UPI00062E0646|nr:protein phosphatase 2C domain-containing protein [Streptomyces sp. CNQ-509]AKH82887.1 hypothetical protein AA958_12310 [Streptomyces sp. CNQ-509]
MIVDTLSEPAESGRRNEDHTRVCMSAGNDGIAVVVDGVTPAGPSVCRHGVAWFAARIADEMARAAESQREGSLADCLAQAVTRTAAAHGDGCAPTAPGAPEATMVALRWDANRVDYLVISDATLLFENADGAVEAVLESSLDRVLSRPEVSRLRAEYEAWPVGSVERERAVRAYSDLVDGFRNTPSGFHTVSGDPAVADYTLCGSRPRGELRSAAALTDGMARWRDLFGFGGWEDLLALLRTRGTSELVRQVRSAEDADPQGIRFPRRKARDDASAVYLRW